MPHKGFRKRAHRALEDTNLQEALRRATHSFDTRRSGALASLENSEALRDQASKIRSQTMSQIDRHLATLTEQVKARGGTVHFCDNPEAVHQTVLEISEKRGRPSIIKSKSMATEEIHLNTALEAAGLTTVETDLGEWILQLAGEPPSHLIAPAIHKTTEQIADIFHEKFGVSLPPTENEAMTAFARSKLRETFLTAGIGISGVNFAIAETGTVVLVTNEGNGRMVTSIPPVHIAVMGLEKVVPTAQEVCLLLKLLARCGTGQKMTAYVTMVTGTAKKIDRAEEPEEFHLIIHDGGRSAHLSGPFQEALNCIKCGACLNACPVYRKVGGHAYDSTYPGPIGSILSPMLWGHESSGDLPYASSLCGACLDACPVKVDIPRMLLEMRAAATEKKETPFVERVLFRTGGLILRNAMFYQTVTWLASKAQRLFLEDGGLTWAPWPVSRWTRKRWLPALARHSFQSRWKELQWGDPLPSEQKLSGNGSQMSVERDQAMIRRVRRSLKTGVPHASGLRVHPVPPPPGNQPERFCTELEAVNGKVYRAVGIGEASQTVAQLIREREIQTLACWDTPMLRILEGAIATEGYNAEWLWGPSRHSDFEQLKTTHLGITEADFGMAASGTLVLLAKPGRSRLISLLPEIHLAILPENRLIEGLEDIPEIILDTFRLKNGTNGAQAIDFITGPSRSSDIGMVPTLGAHGPKEVHVILLQGGSTEGSL